MFRYHRTMMGDTLLACIYCLFLTLIRSIYKASDARPTHQQKKKKAGHAKMTNGHNTSADEWQKCLQRLSKTLNTTQGAVL